MANPALKPERRTWRRLLRPASGLLLLPATLLLPGMGHAQSPSGSQPSQPTTPQGPQDSSQRPTDPSAMTPGNTAPGTTGPGATGTTGSWTPQTANPTPTMPDTGGSGTLAPDATGAPGTLLERPGEDEREDPIPPGSGGSGSDPARQLGEPTNPPIPGMEQTVPPQVEVPRPPTPQGGSQPPGP